MFEAFAVEKKNVFVCSNMFCLSRAIQRLLGGKLVGEGGVKKKRTKKTNMAKAESKQTIP